MNYEEMSDEDEKEDADEDCAGVIGGTNICGCTDITAINYDSTATFDDGSCEALPIIGLWEFDHIFTVADYDTLGLVYNDNIGWWAEITENSYKEYFKGGTADSICYYEGSAYTYVISQLGDSLFHLDITIGDNTFGLELEVKENRLYWNSDNDALDEAAASAIKIDSYDFTPLCE